MWYKGYTGLRFHFDARKDRKLREDHERGIGFAEAEEIFSHRYFSELPEREPGAVLRHGLGKGANVFVGL